MRVCVERKRGEGGLCVFVGSYVCIAVHTVLRIVKPMRIFVFVIIVMHLDPRLVLFHSLLNLFGLQERWLRYAANVFFLNYWLLFICRDGIVGGAGECDRRRLRPVTVPPCPAAAGGGQLSAVKGIRARGCHLDDRTDNRVARKGHLEV